MKCFGRPLGRSPLSMLLLCARGSLLFTLLMFFAWPQPGLSANDRFFSDEFGAQLYIGGRLKLLEYWKIYCFGDTPSCLINVTAFRCQKDSRPRLEHMYEYRTERVPHHKFVKILSWTSSVIDLTLSDGPFEIQCAIGLDRELRWKGRSFSCLSLQGGEKIEWKGLSKELTLKDFCGEFIFPAVRD